MNTDVAIPFLDLVTPHVELETELTALFSRILHSASFVGGPLVEEFESAFATFCETRHSVAVNSGTDALRFAIMASRVQPGDVVVTVPNTFIATTEAISQARAVPEFVDVDEQTYNMSVVMLRAYLEKKCVRDNSGRLISLRSGRPVSAIIPVHLYGQMADMDGILDLANEYGLVVIEDACQAHGAEYFSKLHNRWFKAGSMGNSAAFSFYPGKNLGACGEGGAVTTNDSSVAGTIRMLRDHGQAKKYHHDLEGYNGRLDTIQAAILHAKLPHLAGWNQQRRLRAEEYNRLLSANNAVIRPYEPSWSRAVHHLYVIRTGNRDGLIEFLRTKGISTAIHYPVPLHQQKPYAFLNYTRDDLPLASQIATEIVSLPMFPQLTEEQQARVVEAIYEFTQPDSGKVVPSESIERTAAQIAPSPVLQG
jgi:dTDP-4-amino-4,6-dideoxygalactose transaminase